jgi:soluble lytic murein transglycosylase-like protein
MTADEIASIIESAAARHGVPTDALMAIANIESSGNINADNPTSSASGLFQFVDSTAREYGLTGAKRNDPAAQAEAAAKMMATNARSLERTLGR